MSRYLTSPKIPSHEARLPGRALPHSQSGVVLLIALIVLVAMTLAGIAMTRSVDTGTLVAGNIAFRQGAAQAGDKGTEAARTWLLANNTALDSNSTTNGYYSTRQDNVDLTGNVDTSTADLVDWEGNTTAVTKPKILPIDVGTGNTVAYLIQRMCSITGSINASGQSCASSTANATGSSLDVADYSGYGLTSKSQIYYRVTSRIKGPKDTITFVQAVILI